MTEEQRVARRIAYQLAGYDGYLSPCCAEKCHLVPRSKEAVWCCLDCGQSVMSDYMNWFIAEMNFLTEA